MEFKKKKSGSRKKIVMAVVLVMVLVLALGGGGYWAWLTVGQNNTNGKDSNKQTDKKDRNNDKSDNKFKSRSTGQSNQPTIEAEKNLNVNNTADVPADNGQLTIVINSTNVSGGTLSINADIQQVVTGSCTLTIGGYSTTVDIIANPQNSSCAGFTVPTSAYSGNDFTITARAADGKTGSISGTIK